MADRPLTSLPNASTFPATFLENIGFVVNKVAEKINHQVEQVTLPYGLNRRQYGLMLLLQNEGSQAQIVLSQRVGVDPTNVMRTVDLLEERGFVRRDPDPTDRRKHSVAITDTGAELLARTLPEIRRAESEITAVLSDQEQAQLLGLLGRLLEFSGGT
jgi:MarR family transcriptional regulator, lower aerobic nicotinate degradation pathway regulator